MPQLALICVNVDDILSFTNLGVSVVFELPLSFSLFMLSISWIFDNLLCCGMSRRLSSDDGDNVKVFIIFEQHTNSVLNYSFFHTKYFSLKYFCFPLFLPNSSQTDSA